MGWTIKITRQIYQSSGAFAIYAGESEDGASLTLKGDLAGLAEGDIVEAEGTLGDYRGRPQIAVTSYRATLPASRHGLAAYLCTLDGIGPATAERILDAIGAEGARDALLGDPGEMERIAASIPSITAKARAALVAVAAERGGDRDLQIWLSGLGLTVATIRRVLSEWGRETAAILRANPYRLSDIAGIGFLKADAFAQAAGVRWDDPRRLRAAVLYVLEQETDAGHCYLTREQLHAAAWEWLARSRRDGDVDDAQVVEAVGELVAMGRIVDSGGLYPARLYVAEQDTALELARLLRANIPPLPADGVARALGAYEARAGLTLDPSQRAAILGILAHPVAVLVGGPGTGKTTISRALLECLRAAGQSVTLLAPTGRAAHRQGQVCGQEASTIHRALGRDPVTGAWLRGPDNPLDGAAVLVDEVSMVDVDLARALLRAIKTGTRVVLVGDPDQLQSVGPGNVLADLLASEAVPTYRLTHVHRQAAGSMVIQAAYGVLEGRTPEAVHGRDLSATPGTVYELPTVGRDGQDDPGRVVRWALSKLRSEGVRPSDVQILSPQHRGPAGTTALNQTMQAWANPDGPPAVGDLRVGDRVIQTRNNYDLSIWNGDVGELVHAGDRPALRDDGAPRTDRTGRPVLERFVRVDFGDGRTVTIGEKDAGDLQLAYAVSVHKMQGSECPVVLLVLHPSHYRMLTRSIIYTGITRARDVIGIVGDRRTVAMAARDVAAVDRQTQLAARLREAVSVAPAAAAL